MMIANTQESPDSRLLDVVRECSEKILSRSSDKVDALILTGSVARGEDTYLPDDDGLLKLLGDVEFILVSVDKADVHDIEMEFESILTDELKSRGINVSVDIGVARPNYFLRLKPSIFAVELKAHGKVVAGDRRFLDTIPDFGLNDIPRSDALNLLFNRMVEQMMSLDKLMYGGYEDIKRAHYKNLKLTLDMCTSLLAFTKNYKTTYLERSDLISDAIDMIEHQDTRSSLAGLPAEVRDRTMVKLNQKTDRILNWNGEPAFVEAYRKEVLDRWFELAGMLRSLWTWEVNRYVKGEWTDDFEVLLSRYLKCAHTFERIKGWGRCLIRLRQKGAVSYQRILRLLFLSSPKALTYASAATLYFSLSSHFQGAEDALWRKKLLGVCEWLPEQGDATDWTSVCQAINKNWSELIKYG